MGEGGRTFVAKFLSVRTGAEDSKLGGIEELGGSEGRHISD